MNFLIPLVVSVFLITGDPIDSRIKDGMSYTETVSIIGTSPDFAYENVVADVYGCLKFGVYGFIVDSEYYGLQCTNDTVVDFIHFKNKKEYLEYINKP